MLGWMMSKLLGSREKKTCYLIRYCLLPEVMIPVSNSTCVLLYLTSLSAHQSEGQITGCHWHQHHLPSPTTGIKGKDQWKQRKTPPPSAWTQ